MIRPVLTLAVCAAMLPLGACNTVFGSPDNFKAFLADVQTCDRHYTVAFSAGSAPLNGSAQIDCKARAPAVGLTISAATPTSAPAQ